jgi:hypothetical protein
MKQVRVAIADIELGGDPYTKPFAVAWPFSNCPEDLTPELAANVSAELGGMPVLLVAEVGPDERHTYGECRHAVASRALKLEYVRWVLFEVRPEPQPAGTELARGLASPRAVMPGSALLLRVEDTQARP